MIHPMYITMYIQIYNKDERKEGKDDNGFKEQKIGGKSDIKVPRLDLAEVLKYHYQSH